MNRRNFCLNTALGTAGIFLVPKMLADHGVVLGHNNKKYRISTRWSQADVSRNPVNDCHEMVQDSKGRILLLTNETRNNVLVYDKNGKILEAWGTEFPGAHGLTLFDENGTDVLFICDNQRHQVIKTSMDGRTLLTLEYPKEAEIYNSRDAFIPTETAIAPNGDIYVADGYGQDYLIQYDANGRYIRHFGGKGEGAEYLKNAHGVCVDLRNPAQPGLIVTSREQNAFKRFDLDGNYLSTIPLPGAWVCRPVIRGNFLYAAVLQSSSRPWQKSGFVTILDQNDRVVSNLAGSEPSYENEVLGEMYQTVRAFQYPHDVCIDDEENMYVAQWNSGKVYPYKLEPVV